MSDAERLYHLDIPPVAILAGGLGTRLGSRAGGLPKPLVEVAGEPFLFHLMRRLAAAGARRLVLCVGHLGEEVERIVGSRRFGMDVAYSFDTAGLDGTLGALRRARDLLGERFLVHYGDTLLTMDFRGLVESWTASGLSGMLAVLENHGRWGTSNTEVRGHLVVAHDKLTRTTEMTWIDYGAACLTGASLDAVPTEETDLTTLYSVLARSGRLGAFRVSERFYEIGTPEALEETERYLIREPK
jgi:NDP-sugar pyrophosphorylase family protein